MSNKALAARSLGGTPQLTASGESYRASPAVSRTAGANSISSFCSNDSLGRPHLHSPSLACRVFLIKKPYSSKIYQNVQSSITRTRGDRAAAVRLEYRNETMLGDTPTTRGRVPVQKARSGGRALKQESVPGLGSSDVSVVRTRGC
jgi:hypothetical protein